MNDIETRHMILDSRKEDFQYAYLSALCADADINIERTHHDHESNDATLHKIVSVDGEELMSSIILQLKCSSSRNNCRITDNEVVYDLPVKNYNDLRLQGLPMLLMLLVLPVDQDPIKWTLDDLLLRGTMYYKCLQGEPETSNKESVAIQFSKDNNVVNCEKLNCLMIQAAKGELDGTIK